MNASLETIAEDSPAEYSKRKIQDHMTPVRNSEFIETFPSYESIDWHDQPNLYPNMRRWVSHSEKFYEAENSPQLSPNLYEDTPPCGYKATQSQWRMSRSGKKLFHNSLESDGFSEGCSSYETINCFPNSSSMPDISMEPSWKQRIQINQQARNTDEQIKDYSKVYLNETFVNYDKNQNENIILITNYTDIKQVEDSTIKLLKMDRSKACITMRQASNLLKTIKERNMKRHLSVELLAERILLESDIKNSSLEHLLANWNVKKENSVKFHHVGTISISNFHFPLKPKTTKPESCEFYVLAATSDSKMQFSKTVQPFEDTLDFGETFTFTDLEADFKITIGIYCIRLKEPKRSLKFLFKKIKKPTYTEATINFEDIQRNTNEEVNILKTSFKLVGEISISKENIGQRSPWVLNYVPATSRLQNKANFTFNLDRLLIESRLAGFMNMGQEIGERIFWEKKWCVLRETQLKIFNYPSYEDFVDPIQCINLIYCLEPCTITTNGKKRSFLLKIARPSTSEDIDRPSLRSRPNFVLDKYYFSSDTSNDFQKWNHEVNYVIKTLIDWKRLVFVENNITS